MQIEEPMETLSGFADLPALGRSLYSMVERLYPICRSITGEGVRATLRDIGTQIPLRIHEVPTGTQVFDWTVPREWNIRDAYLIGPSGDKLIDFKAHNLHVLNYSVPVRAKMSLSELKPHLFSLPAQPDWIPYRTSYYKDNWGFCLTDRQLQSFPEGMYEVCIDSSLEAGSLTYGEYMIPGTSSEEVLISCHVCHPSLCNDNLSGIAVATQLASYLGTRQNRYTYRFLFIPGTIGSITWLARNEDSAARIKHGLVMVCVGDPGPFTYKKSRHGNAMIDRAVMHVLKTTTEQHHLIDFYPYGYDERQYSSPGFNLPVGSLSRSSHGQYPQYHTSADNLDLVRPECLAEALEKYRLVIDVLEHDRTYVNLNPKCEPQLGRRGLYRQVGSGGGTKINEMALLWVLNLSDGAHSLLDIAERSGERFSAITEAANALVEVNLLKPKNGN